jgi:small subunit ribosomal protein S16
MVRLRLTRRGAKKRPFYRVIAADQRAPRDGRFIEQLGFYDPMQEPKKIELKLDRVDYWLENGAQATDTVQSLINKFRTAQEG